MDLQTEIQAFLTQFEALANEDYKNNIRTLTPSDRFAYGVSVPKVREISHTWRQAHKDLDRTNLLMVVETLWAGRSMEEQTLALELLRRYPYQIPALQWDHFDRWRQRLDNWGATDGLGVYIFGRWLLADPIDRLPYLQLLIHEDDVWSRRLAIVSTVWLNRGQHNEYKSFPNLTLDLLNQVRAERHPMITKAISWALRELTKKHPAQVAAYVDENEPILAAHVKREVRTKLATGTKSGKSRKSA